MKSLGRLALTYACSPSLFLRFHDSYGLFIWARLTRPISPWVHMRNFSPVSEMRNGQRSWGRVPAQRDKKADMRNTKIINFAPIIAFATLKAESLQLIAMLMMRKMQQANTRRCHLGQNSSCFHPGNRADEACFKRRATAVPNSTGRIKFDFSTTVARRLKPSRATAV